MGNKKTKPALILCVFVCAFMLTGCIAQRPTLTDITREIATPEPLPDIIKQKVYYTPELDAMGDEVLEYSTHYNKYISFERMRVYEYGGDTFLDGVCVNSYPEPLYGAFTLLFHDSDGVLSARGDLYFDEDRNIIPSGQTRVFAYIDTDMNVEHLPMSIAYNDIIRPASSVDTE